MTRRFFPLLLFFFLSFTIFGQTEKNSEPLKTGSLSLTSDPSGAKVLIQGKPVGVTPLEIASYPIGTYEVIIQKKGSYRKKIGVVITEGNTTKTTVTLLQPAKLTIITSPADAIISLNNKNIGTSPLTKSPLKPRNYSVTITKDGYKTENKTVTLQSRDNDTLTVSLQKIDPSESAITTTDKPQGQLTLISEPSEAFVILNGKVIGQTPLMSYSVPNGENTIVLKRKGCYSKTLRLSVAAGQPTRKHVTLLQPASLRITSTPDSATIIINGKNVGQTPYVREKIRPAVYSIEISKEGYTTEGKNIEIQSKAQESLTITLSPKTIEKKVAKKTETKSKVHKIALGVFAGLTTALLFSELIQSKD